MGCFTFGLILFTAATTVLACDNDCGLTESKGCGPPANCYEIKHLDAASPSGIYKVWPKYLNREVCVYCDMTTDGGGWTVFQRREQHDGQQEDFFRNWADYKKGFGNLNREFWLGNDAIFALSSADDNVLRVELEDFEGNNRYATYDAFQVAPEINKYQLKVSGYKGDAGDSMNLHQGQLFSTKDSATNGCPNAFKGGWWYENCYWANLNGVYLKGKYGGVYGLGVTWRSWLDDHYSLKKTEMKMRPK